MKAHYEEQPQAMHGQIEQNIIRDKNCAYDIHTANKCHLLNFSAHNYKRWKALSQSLTRAVLVACVFRVVLG